MIVSNLNDNVLKVFNTLKKRNESRAKEYANVVLNVLAISTNDIHIYKCLIPGFGEEKEYDYKGCKIKVGRNVDRRNNVITYVDDPEIIPYRMIFNDKQPELPTQIDNNQMKLRGYQIRNLIQRITTMKKVMLNFNQIQKTY